jgi:hypothetical protein
MFQLYLALDSMLAFEQEPEGTFARLKGQNALPL